VLIAAARGKGPVWAKALEILDDPERKFVSSIFVRMEVLPKAVFHRNEAEVHLYEAFFADAAVFAEAGEEFLEEAWREACASGLDAMDAFHICAAVSTSSDELITTERLGRSIHRTKAVRVVSIHPVLVSD